MGKETEKCSASKLYSLEDLYIKYILHASMHYVSRELAQQLTVVENLLLIIKMNKFGKFFSQSISLYLLIFLLRKMLKPNANKC